MGQDLHPHFSVITCGSEHTRICRIPCYSVDTPGRMALKSFNERAIFLVPDVDLGVWKRESMAVKHTTDLDNTFATTDDQILVCATK